MKRFIEWFNRSCKPIGYTLGGLNVLVGVNHLLHGDTGLAMLWFAIAGMIIIGTYEIKQ